MTKRIVKQTAQLLLSLWALASLTFLLLHLIPGDPVLVILGEGANSQDMQRLRSQLHLDRPLVDQYGEYCRRLLQLDLGHSLISQQPVLQEMLNYLPNTMVLASSSLLLALLVSFPLGIRAAGKINRWEEMLVTAATTAGMAVPGFLLGLLLLLVFSVHWKLLPVSGDRSALHLVLPTLTLAVPLSAQLTRTIKTTLQLEMQKPYALLARAKGLDTQTICRRHLLPNAWPPILTLIGLQIGALLSGVMVTETVFSWPGIGVLLLSAVRRRDYPVIQGVVALVGALYLLIHFLVDLAYLLVDPRIRIRHEN